MTRALDRQEQRRRQILASAGQLLRAHGWHAVGVDEIGEAAGMTGPAVYRYFDNKQALLTAAMSYAAEQLWNSVPDGDDPDLSSFVAGHVDFVLENADLIELWYREAQNLAPDALRSHRRLQRRYMEKWVDALVKERPEVDVEEGRLMVRAAIGLVHSIAHRSANPYRDRRDRDRERDSLIRMARAALAA